MIETLIGEMRMDGPTRMTTPDVSTWPERIRQARKNAKLTQAELGDKVGASQNSISDWETGKAEPNLSQFRAIAAVTSVDTAWILFGREPGNSDTLPTIAAEAQKENRHFAWMFHEIARMFTEEGVKADFLTVLAFTQKILAATKKGADEPGAQEALAREIENERVELRDGLKKFLKDRL